MSGVNKTEEGKKYCSRPNNNCRKSITPKILKTMLQHIYMQQNQKIYKTSHTLPSIYNQLTSTFVDYNRSS